jgi:hypothetical protein
MRSDIHHEVVDQLEVRAKGLSYRQMTVGGEGTGVGP